MRLREYFALVVITMSSACATAPAEEPAEVQMRESLSEAEKAQFVPGPVPQRKEAPEAQVQPLGENDLEVVQLFQGESHIAGSGLEVTLVAKQLHADGTQLDLRFARGEETFDVSHKAEQFYVEGIAYGILYSVSANDSQTMLTLHGRAPDAPIDVASAAEIAGPILNEKVDCREAERFSALGEPYGTIQIRGVRGEQPKLDIVCAVRVGLYTKRIID